MECSEYSANFEACGSIEKALAASEGATTWMCSAASRSRQCDHARRGPIVIDCDRSLPGIEQFYDSLFKHGMMGGKDVWNRNSGE